MGPRYECYFIKLFNVARNHQNKIQKDNLQAKRTRISLLKSFGSMQYQYSRFPASIDELISKNI